MSNDNVQADVYTICMLLIKQIVFSKFILSENQCSSNLMVGVYLLCITRVAELVRCTPGFCKSAKHTYCPASESTRSLIVNWLIPELEFVIINLPPFIMVLPLRLHVIETILCDGCKLVTVHVAVTNLPATGLLVVKLTCTSARKVHSSKLGYWQLLSRREYSYSYIYKTLGSLRYKFPCKVYHQGLQTS